MKKITAEIYFDPMLGYVCKSDRDIRRIEDFARDNARQSGEVTLTVGEPSKSVQQMRFYRGPLTKAFIDATGESNTEYLHYHLKEMYLKRRDDGGREWVPSLADLDVHEMSAFIEACLQELANCGGSLGAEGFHELERIRK